jgi:hypothetical protein
MDISPTGQFALLSAQTTNPVSSSDMQRTVRVLKVAQDQAKAEGQALVQLINEAPPLAPRGTRVDLYV